MSKRRAAFLTLGCKVNRYQTDAMEEILEKAGYEIVDFKETADVYIINTCFCNKYGRQKKQSDDSSCKEKRIRMQLSWQRGVMCRQQRKNWQRKMRRILLSVIIKRKISPRFLRNILRQKNQSRRYQLSQK